MNHHVPTTPFGRRPLSLAMMHAQSETTQASPAQVAHKWHVWRNLTEAKERLNLSDRTLAVLNALLSFHQETALVYEADLVVFPSNRELSIRAHGMAPATLRRHLAALVEAGLVIRRDSPNGKRYARKGEGGTIEQSFGFDLKPLIVRSAEIETLAKEVRAERKATVLMREQITLLRRDIAKTIAAGIELDVPAPWLDYSRLLRDLSQGLLRTLQSAELETRQTALEALYAQVAKSLAGLTKDHNLSVNESHDERHIQNSKQNHFIESAADFREEKKENKETQPVPRKPVATFPLAVVLDACPAIGEWTSEPIRNWKDFIRAASVARSALGISTSAWEDAIATMGAAEAAVTVAAILQKANAITAPGGYLRALTEKARVGRFSLGPILMALLRARLPVKRAATG